jgi:translation initiation factor 2D
VKDIKPEPLVMSVLATHPDVVSHQPYTSLRDIQIKEEKRGRREEEERTKVREMEVRELWKPHAASGYAMFFAEGGFEYVISNPSPRRHAELSRLMYYVVVQLPGAVQLF